MCSHLHVCGDKHCEAIDVIEARFEKSGSGVDFRLEALLGSPTKKLLSRRWRRLEALESHHAIDGHRSSCC
jgi:hypothetical protein